MIYTLEDILRMATQQGGPAYEAVMIIEGEYTVLDERDVPVRSEYRRGQQYYANGV